MYTLIFTLTPTTGFLFAVFLTTTLNFLFSPFLAVNCLGVNLAGAFLITNWLVFPLAVKFLPSFGETTTLYVPGLKESRDILNFPSNPV